MPYSLKLKTGERQILMSEAFEYDKAGIAKSPDKQMQKNIEKYDKAYRGKVETSVASSTSSKTAIDKKVKKPETLTPRRPEKTDTSLTDKKAESDVRKSCEAAGIPFHYKMEGGRLVKTDTSQPKPEAAKKTPLDTRQKL